MTKLSFYVYFLVRGTKRTLGIKRGDGVKVLQQIIFFLLDSVMLVLPHT
jgi:hypothetical protein